METSRSGTRTGVIESVDDASPPSTPRSSLHSAPPPSGPTVPQGTPRTGRQIEDAQRRAERFTPPPRTPSAPPQDEHFAPEIELAPLPSAFTAAPDDAPGEHAAPAAVQAQAPAPLLPATPPPPGAYGWALASTAASLTYYAVGALGNGLGSLASSAGQAASSAGAAIVDVANRMLGGSAGPPLVDPAGRPISTSVALDASGAVASSAIALAPLQSIPGQIPGAAPDQPLADHVALDIDAFDPPPPELYSGPTGWRIASALFLQGLHPFLIVPAATLAGVWVQHGYNMAFEAGGGAAIAAYAGLGLHIGGAGFLSYAYHFMGLDSYFRGPQAVPWRGLLAATALIATVAAAGSAASTAGVTTLVFTALSNTLTYSPVRDFLNHWFPVDHAGRLGQASIPLLVREIEALRGLDPGELRQLTRADVEALPREALMRALVGQIENSRSPTLLAVNQPLAIHPRLRFAPAQPAPAAPGAPTQLSVRPEAWDQRLRLMLYYTLSSAVTLGAVGTSMGQLYPFTFEGAADWSVGTLILRTGNETLDDLFQELDMAFRRPPPGMATVYVPGIPFFNPPVYNAAGELVGGYQHWFGLEYLHRSLALPRPAPASATLRGIEILTGGVARNTNNTITSLLSAFSAQLFADGDAVGGGFLAALSALWNGLTRSRGLQRNMVIQAIRRLHLEHFPPPPPPAGALPPVPMPAFQGP